ncbi:hypothetical protein [Amycolatopsis sp. H20-H5]|uniref:hypothetical protein n=1 Tax=Amycolatopsis sp. H20-H5 TaxID=3046309 RepID=UPI002DBF37D9|nr:hypothetical protein [Amycolatopsis sp. H20-H5]MEC3981891.1 hypothetical protein [Amycolatopsis sp. H20-H5]
MVTLAARKRVPGRQRFAGIFSGDTATFIALFAGGLLVTAFYRLEWWHNFLFGRSTTDFPAAYGLIAAACAMGWRGLLRRGFVWAEPAQLTWMDFASVDRRRVVAGRLWASWTGVTVTVGYLGALVVAAGRGLDETWAAAAALVGASALLAMATARRTRLPGETAGPLVLAVAGLLVAADGLGPRPVEVLAGVLLAAALVTAFTGDSVSHAGRLTLVEGWNGRLLRAMAVTFVDPMLILPEARPVGWLSLRHPTALRLALAGVAGRSRYFGSALLITIMVGAGRVALPALPGVVLLSLGAFAVLMPFGGGLGELWRNAGRRRWLGTPDRELIVVHGLVFAGLVAVWGVLLALVALWLGVVVPGSSWLALPLAVLAVLRAVARPPINYSVSGGGLMGQALRGPDVLVGGTLVLLLLG